MNSKNNGYDRKPINLKLTEEKKEKFKQIAHDRGTSMQDILQAFVNAYVENPERFQVKMEIV